MKPALLVIDIQKAFFRFDDFTTKSLNGTIEYANAAIAIFREKGYPVISIQHMDVEDGLIPGSDGFDLPESLDIEPDDLHFHKTYGNALIKTGLHEKLKDLEVDTLIICGFRAENCILSTYRGAEDMDLFPILLRGGIAGGDPDRIKFVEDINEVISIWALERLLP